MRSRSADDVGLTVADPRADRARLQAFRHQRVKLADADARGLRAPLRWGDALADRLLPRGGQFGAFENGPSWARLPSGVKSARRPDTRKRAGAGTPAHCAPTAGPLY